MKQGKGLWLKAQRLLSMLAQPPCGVLQGEPDVHATIIKLKNAPALLDAPAGDAVAKAIQRRDVCADQSIRH